MMRWLEPYIADVNSSNTPSNTSSSAQPNNATAGSTTPNASTLQSSQQTISSAQKMPAPKEETLSCFMSEPDLASQDANASVVVSTSEDGVLLNSYDQPANSQSTTPQQAAIQSVNAPPAHHDYATVQQRSAAVLPNGSNTPSNTNTKKNNQKSTTGPPSTTGSPCSSTTSSEIDVGSVTTFSNHQPQTQQITSPHQSNMLVLTPVSQQQRPAPTQQIVYTKTDPQPAIGEPIHTDDGSVVTVTARGTAPVATILKKDLNIRTNDGGTLTMFIDPTTFYQHGSQKMYRLVNVSELNAADMAALTNASNVTTVNNVSTNNDVKVLTSVPIRRKRLAPTSSASGISNGRGQLGDDLILDDGISEKTVTIDQTSQSSLANDRLLMDQHVVTVGSPNVVLTQPNIHQVHHQAHAGTSQQHGGLNASGHHTITQHIPSNTGQLSTVQIRQQSAQQVSSQQHQSSTQRYTIAQTAPTITIQQPQYTILSSHPIQTQTDADIAFANSIASHLSRLNEDEKAVAKMNIQRILMDARFGMGACARMIHDEELNEASSNANHQVINVNVTHQRQQHVDGGASGR
ncbi:unnamed protein product [Anisakis simplex]|uniref:BESS domain-containing protein n=1 Tax=Anisakis simplex TaxID=6269 RepID=A0A0M3K746_ANISI|nr:unnamed protein product [Anisakis simplex]